MNFSLGAIAQYGALVRQCQESAVNSLLIVVALVMAAAAFFTESVDALSFLKELRW